MNDYANLIEDSDELEAIQSSGISLVSQLVSELRETDNLIASATSELKALNEKKAQLEQKRIPDAMSELGFTELKLVDGKKLSIKQEFHASIAGERKNSALAWLREHGMEDVIKADVSATFNKGQFETALALFSELSEKFPENKVDIGETVHPSTLKALVKEQFEAGEPMPDDIFGVHIINRAIIK